MSGDISYSIRRRTLQGVAAMVADTARRGLLDYQGERVEMPLSISDVDLEKAVTDLIAKVAGVSLEVV